MKLFSLLPKRLVHFACNSPPQRPSPLPSRPLGRRRPGAFRTVAPPRRAGGAARWKYPDARGMF